MFIYCTIQYCHVSMYWFPIRAVGKRKKVQPTSGIYMYLSNQNRQSTQIFLATVQTYKGIGGTDLRKIFCVCDCHVFDRKSSNEYH